MDLTQIETAINAVVNEIAKNMQAQDYTDAYALAELGEKLVNIRQGMK